LAHYGGLSKIGQAIYKTRFHIEESIIAVQTNSGILHLPFVWYSKFFLKLTTGLFHTQELNADYISAKYMGTETVICALNKIDELNVLFSYYWSSEIEPILNQLYYPPVIAGFKRFLESPDIQKILPMLSLRLDNMTKQEKNVNHPSTKERIVAVSRARFKQPEMDTRPSLNLISNTNELELELFQTIPNFTENIIQNLKPISWDEVENNLWKKIIEDYIGKHKEVFKNITPGDFPGFVSNPDKLLNLLKNKVNTLDDKGGITPIADTEEEKSFKAQKILTRALLFILLKDYWRGNYSLGKEVVLYKNNEEICPGMLLKQLFSSGQTSYTWRDICNKYGFTDTKIWQ
jgi:hypothetical protein